jgi:hypothetical protein
LPAGRLVRCLGPGGNFLIFVRRFYRILLLALRSIGISYYQFVLQRLCKGLKFYFTKSDRLMVSLRLKLFRIQGTTISVTDALLPSLRASCVISILVLYFLFG